MVTQRWPISGTERLIALIRNAFDGVTLGNGIGLREGAGRDDFLDKQALSELRQHDEKLDWSKISDSELRENVVGLTYFDPEGMRFHLPAFLIADLRGVYLATDMIFELSYSGSGLLSRYDLLNESQRNAVREFLRAHLEQATFDADLIRRGLAEYWDREE